MEKSIDLYLAILKEWLNGEGMNFAKHGLNKHDIFIMVTWYQNYLEQKTCNAITLSIINELIS